MATGHYEDNSVSHELASASPAWLKSADPEILLAFLHIPKAGGTSLKAAMQEVYGRHLVDFHSRLSSHVKHQYDSASSREIRALVSHHGYGFHRRLGASDQTHLDGDGIFQGRDIRYITLVRDPIERVKSLYYFVTTFAAHRHYKQTRDMKPDEFFQFMLEHSPYEIQNWQCRLIARGPSPGFDAARKVLDTFYLYAPVEHSEEMLLELARRLKWPCKFEYRRRNTSPREGRAPVSPDLEKRIISFNQEDIKLYRYVKNRNRVHRLLWKAMNFLDR